MSKKPETALDRFKIEEEKIRADVAESEVHYSRIIEEQAKARDKAKAAADRERTVLDSMVLAFERNEAELEAEERARLNAAGLTRAALDDGRISADEFLKAGLTAGEITAKAQAVAGEKLADLRSAIRAKAVKVLELEAAELEAEYNIAFAQTAPAAALRERLAALLKALEASLASPIGLGGEPSAKAMRDAKLTELNNARGKRLTGDGWKDYDLAGLKRLRLDPTWPEGEAMKRLEEIIAEAKTSGRTCRLMLSMTDYNRGVNVMWS